jgi:hypothetical protein
VLDVPAGAEGGVMLLPKGKTRKQLKAREDRVETKVKHAVRAQVFAREGERCAVVSRLNVRESLQVMQRFGICGGMLTWAHLSGHRRSRTMGMDATERHQSETSLALCRDHHYAEERMGLRFDPQDEALGMNGPISWSVQAPKGRMH